MGGGGVWRPGGPFGPPGQPNKKAGTGGKASGSRFSGREAPRRRPGAHPTVTCYPAPACIRRQYGGYPGGAGRPERTCGGRRRSGAGAFGPGPRTCPLPGKARQRAGGLRPPAAAPPRRWDFHQRQKRQRKSPAPRSMGPGTRNVGRKVRGNGSTPRAKPLPTPYGQRRLKPPRRGLRTPGNRARCCATLAVRAGPPWA